MSLQPWAEQVHEDAFCDGIPEYSEHVEEVGVGMQNGAATLEDTADELSLAPHISFSPGSGHSVRGGSEE